MTPKEAAKWLERIERKSASDVAIIILPAEAQALALARRVLEAWPEVVGALDHTRRCGKMGRDCELIDAAWKRAEEAEK